MNEEFLMIYYITVTKYIINEAETGRIGSATAGTNGPILKGTVDPDTSLTINFLREFDCWFHDRTIGLKFKSPSRRV